MRHDVCGIIRTSTREMSLQPMPSPQLSQSIALETSAELIGLLYVDLKRMARRERGRAGRPATLQTTALIHEAYLKVHDNPAWGDREHFLRAVATAMRQVLVDSARARLRLKRGSGVAALPLEAAEAVQRMPERGVVELNDALELLGALDPRLVQVVECRFFAGFTDEQTAQALRLSDRTVRRDWEKARAWLYRELQPD